MHSWAENEGVTPAALTQVAAQAAVAEATPAAAAATSSCGWLGERLRAQLAPRHLLDSAPGRLKAGVRLGASGQTACLPPTEEQGRDSQATEARP